MRRPILAGAALLAAACGSQEKAGNAAAEANEAAPAADGGAAPAAGGGGAALALTPGEYETRIEVLRINMLDAPGLPKGMTSPLPPTTTVRSCLTPEQTRRPDANFLTGSGAQGGCAYENFSMAGGRIQGSVVCNNAGTRMRTTMNGQFTPQGYQMESESRVEGNGVTMETASRITTRRLGDCAADPK